MICECMGKIYLGYFGEVLSDESSEVLEKVAQRDCGCPGIQGQVRWGHGQPEG